ncbi:transposase family protein [Thioflavicoccus mobilis 8321]|uniref:Transposase family protein n=1 Tax=Thioflavicoccus mobilis 8321 TaxID=765912 RepID=L0GVG1_9GAMM|nr:ISL3 family transposase [Thioflavicoccus mobilis]AGA89822.1 transposase family protein [Thioflavicoccus mobilis 8321]
MATEHGLFTAALGLSPPWQVTDVRFDPQGGRIDFEVGFAQGGRFACPACAAEAQAVHDTRERSWRHLHFFQFQAFIHAKVPRVRCQACGKTTQVPVPWARKGSGFTQRFEALALTLCQAMAVNTVCRHLGISGGALWRILKYYVGTARAREDFRAVRSVGIDETAARRGQNYISLFHDLAVPRLLFACPGRDQRTVKHFAADLAAHGGSPESVTAACLDMSKAYIAGVTKHLPNAAITFDVFHLVSLANQALDEVRGEERRTEPALRHSRWTWLKDKHQWSDRQIEQFHRLSRMRLKTARAWRLKESLRELFATATSAEEAREQFARWYSWARRARLAPMKRLAATLKAHLPGILNGFDSGLTNAAVEGSNSLIQAAKARARGYRTKDSFIAIAYLVAGKLNHLPASPYTTASCVRASA